MTKMMTNRQQDEAMKDDLFSSMVGFRKDSEMTSEESLMLCQDFRRSFVQPAIFGISNDRGFTDRINLPTHYDFDEAQQEAIKEVTSKLRAIEVTDKEIEEARVASLNNLTQGDAVAQVLQTKLSTYKGLEDDWASSRTNGVVVDTMYCAITRKTVYCISTD